MASNNRDVGIYKILIDEVPADGSTMPADSAMILINKIKPDTVALEKDDNTFVTTKNQEDNTVDQLLLTEVGDTNFSFEVWDFSFDNLIRILGGSVVDGKWVEPVNAYRGREVSLRIVTKSGKGLHAVTDFPRIKMQGKINGTLSEGEPSTIMYTFTKLTPQDENGVSKSAMFKYYKPTAPTNPVTDDVADTFGWDYVEGFEDPTEYEYSVDGGSNFSDCTANPQTGISTAVPVGDLKVRVKQNFTATYPNVVGYELANLEPFTV